MTLSRKDQHTLEKVANSLQPPPIDQFISQQPKTSEKAAPMVHVSKNRNHVSSLFESFVTTSAAFWAILRNPPMEPLRLRNAISRSH